MFDALKLMRIPFSIFLMPVFWFALVSCTTIDGYKAVLIFFILHILVYPASNGYNSYFDRDEGSIGGLEKPPKVNRFLFPTVILFDILSILLSLFISFPFAILIAIYILVSKAYSYDKIRLKKYPYLSTLVVTIFQGFYIYLTVQFGIEGDLEPILNPNNLLLAVCSSLFLLGSYPITQIYQHEEDKSRGDETLSIKLGIKGTFIFSMISFLLATSLIFYTFHQQNVVYYFYIFLFAGSPILLYFSFWFSKVLKNIKKANYKYTMQMNMLSSICLTIAFITMICWK